MWIPCSVASPPGCSLPVELVKSVFIDKKPPASTEIIVNQNGCLNLQAHKLEQRDWIRSTARIRWLAW